MELNKPFWPLTTLSVLWAQARTARPVGASGGDLVRSCLGSNRAPIDRAPRGGLSGGGSSSSGCLGQIGPLIGRIRLHRSANTPTGYIGRRLSGGGGSGLF